MGELLGTAAERLSSVSSTAASGLADYLLERIGPQRYLKLLGGALAENAELEAGLGAPLAVIDRDWRPTMAMAPVSATRTSASRPGTRCRRAL